MAEGKEMESRVQITLFSMSKTKTWGNLLVILTLEK
jgi:hypothetical protein